MENSAYCQLGKHLKHLIDYFIQQQLYGYIILLFTFSGLRFLPSVQNNAMNDEFTETLRIEFSSDGTYSSFSRLSLLQPFVQFLLAG